MHWSISDIEQSLKEVKSYRSEYYGYIDSNINSGHNGSVNSVNETEVNDINEDEVDGRERMTKEDIHNTLTTGKGGKLTISIMDDIED